MRVADLEWTAGSLAQCGKKLILQFSLFFNFFFHFFFEILMSVVCGNFVGQHFACHCVPRRIVQRCSLGHVLSVAVQYSLGTLSSMRPTIIFFQDNVFFFGFFYNFKIFAVCFVFQIFGYSVTISGLIIYRNYKSDPTLFRQQLMISQLLVKKIVKCDDSMGNVGLLRNHLCGTCWAGVGIGIGGGSNNDSGKDRDVINACENDLMALSISNAREDMIQQQKIVDGEKIYKNVKENVGDDDINDCRDEEMETEMVSLLPRHNRDGEVNV